MFRGGPVDGLSGRSDLFNGRGGTPCAVDFVGGAGEVVTDLLGDELFNVGALPVALARVRVDVSLCDEAVALGESFMGSLGGGAERDEVVERRLQPGECPIAFPTEVFLPDPRVEPRLALSLDPPMKLVG